MEAKVNLVQKVLLFSKSTISHSSLPHGQRFTLESLERKDLLKGRLKGLSEKWQYRVQEQWKDNYSSQQYLIHIVEKNETLTSISRLYGVSVQSISVVNDKIEDINLVFEGQCLTIPSPGVNNATMDRIRKTWFYCIRARDRYQRSLNIWGSVGNHEVFTTLSSHRLLPANGYFLLLLPLLVFCISCVISSFRRRVGDKLKNQVINEPSAHHRGPRSIHWKTALSDIRDMEVLGSESRQDSINDPVVAEDEVAVSSFEEMSDAYTEMEPAYQKFLSDCGIMSQPGYWRGR